MSAETQINKLTFRDEVSNHLRNEWCNEEAVEAAGRAECEAEFESLLTWLSTPPLYTTLRLNTNLQQETPTTTLVRLRTVLEQQYKNRGHAPPTFELDPQLPDLVTICNSGPHQLQQEDKEVVVGLGCGMAVLRGADVYAQGVMAAPSHLAPGDKVSVMADVEGVVCKGLIKKFTGKKMFVGNGVAEMSRSQLFVGEDKPSGCAIRMTNPLYIAPSLAGLLPAAIFPQNLPSVVCAHVLAPQPGDHVLDMCAAPGGKTTHIATLMKNRGRVVALDKSKGKIKTIETNAATWGLSCILAFHFDSTKALDPSTSLSPGVLPSAPPYAPCTFDRVLLDAPCSALGQRPAVFNGMKLPDVTSYPPLQRKLFTAAVGLLRPGGVLVYSTCTWTLEENEGLVSWALKSFPNISLVPQVPHLGGVGRAGSGLTAEQLARLQRFGPPPTDGAPVSAHSDTIGFFCAKFVKDET